MLEAILIVLCVIGWFFAALFWWTANRFDRVLFGPDGDLFFENLEMYFDNKSLKEKASRLRIRIKQLERATHENV